MSGKIYIGVVIGLMTVFIIAIYTMNIFRTPLITVFSIEKFSFSSFMGFKNDTYSVSKNISKMMKSLFIPKDTNTTFQSGFKHCNKTFQTNHFITVQQTCGRLGNNIFRLLALLSTAKDHCYTPVFTDKLFNITNRLFDLSYVKTIQTIPKQWKVFKEISNGKYSPGITKLDHHRNWSLLGYLQSWRYFGNHGTYIRSMLQFRKEVREPVIKYINSMASLRDKTTICVHNRRGDFLTPILQRNGFGVAGIGYFNKSMQYFIDKFKGTPVAFLILSDDIEWCKKNIKNDTGNVHFSPFSESKSGDSATKDMALLSYCDHSIITGGTFGWIGAWLGNGHVVYFKGYPIPRSKMDRSISRSDYYPPDWVEML